VRWAIFNAIVIYVVEVFSFHKGIDVVAFVLLCKVVFYFFCGYIIYFFFQCFGFKYIVLDCYAYYFFC